MAENPQKPHQQNFSSLLDTQHLNHHPPLTRPQVPQSHYLPGQGYGAESQEFQLHFRGTNCLSWAKVGPAPPPDAPSTVNFISQIRAPQICLEKPQALHLHKHSSNQSLPIQFLQEPMQKGKIHLREWKKAVKSPNSPELGQDSPPTQPKHCHSSAGQLVATKTFQQHDYMVLTLRHDS